MAQQLDAIEEMALQNGTFLVNDTTEFTAEIDAIYISEETIFSSIKINGAENKNSYMSDSSISVKAGVIISPIRGQKFSGVQLVSGSIVAILK